MIPSVPMLANSDEPTRVALKSLCELHAMKKAIFAFGMPDATAELLALIMLASDTNPVALSHKPVTKPCEFGTKNVQFPM